MHSEIRLYISVISLDYGYISSTLTSLSGSLPFTIWEEHVLVLPSILRYPFSGIVELPHPFRHCPPCHLSLLTGKSPSVEWASPQLPDRSLYPACDPLAGIL
jgi:hypothetical protein